MLLSLALNVGLCLRNLSRSLLPMRILSVGDKLGQYNVDQAWLLKSVCRLARGNGLFGKYLPLPHLSLV